MHNAGTQLHTAGLTTRLQGQYLGLGGSRGGSSERECYSSNCHILQPDDHPIVVRHFRKHHCPRQWVGILPI